MIQVDAGWVVLDFEGEPGRRRDERFTLSSPLRDVAGILRSLHYAAAAGLAEWDLGDDELTDLLAPWEERNRAAFLDSYLGYGGIDGLLPADPAARAALLAAFELDKAVYELGYELGHRPDKVSIPLEGIERLVARPRADVTPRHLPTGRPPPVRRGSARAAVGGARRPRDRGRRRRTGTAFAVWAPHARQVSVVGPVEPAGTPPPTRSSASTPACGAASCPGVGSRTPYKYAVDRRRRAHHRTAPTRWRSSPSTRAAWPASCSRASTSGPTPRGWRRARRSTPSPTG